jgi:hypothetical protein
MDRKWIEESAKQTDKNIKLLRVSVGLSLRASERLEKKEMNEKKKGRKKIQ